MLTLLLVTLLDGSTLFLKTPSSATFDVKTEYGILKVPVKDLRHVELGAHVDDEAPYVKAAADLGNINYKWRDKGFVFLRSNQRGAYKYLMKLKDDTDSETARRAELLLKEYRGFFPPLHDTITTPAGVMKGIVKQAEIKGTSDALGETTIKLTYIKSLAFRTQEAKLKLEHRGGWKEYGYVAGKVKITATGQVDLWPSQAGQYMTGPAGMENGGGLPNNYRPGAILGRVNGGETFLVGDWLDANIGVGKLELKINDSAWPNCVPEGSYEVVVE